MEIPKFVRNVVPASAGVGAIEAAINAIWNSEANSVHAATATPTMTPFPIPTLTAAEIAKGQPVSNASCEEALVDLHQPTNGYTDCETLIAYTKSVERRLASPTPIRYYERVVEPTPSYSQLNPDVISSIGANWPPIAAAAGLFFMGAIWLAVRRYGRHGRIAALERRAERDRVRAEEAEEAAYLRGDILDSLNRRAVAEAENPLPVPPPVPPVAPPPAPPAPGAGPAGIP